MSYKRITDKVKLDKYCDNTDCREVEYCKDCYFSNVYNRLAELEDKIEQNKMLELPFLVGQDTFIIENNEIVMGVVNGIWWQDEFLIEVRYGKDKYGWRYAQRLKDGIFSTKAEAEKKLEILKGGAK